MPYLFYNKVEYIFYSQGSCSSGYFLLFGQLPSPQIIQHYNLVLNYDAFPPVNHPEDQHSSLLSNLIVILHRSHIFPRRPIYSPSRQPSIFPTPQRYIKLLNQPLFSQHDDHFVGQLFNRPDILLCSHLDA